MNSTEIERMVLAYQSWAQELIDRGWKMYFMTFMFEDVRGSRDAVQAQMMVEAEKTYARLLKRIMRCPRSAKNLANRPIWIVCPDFPVPKHAKRSLREVMLNGGMHLHGLVFMPAETRLASNDLELELLADGWKYAQPPLTELHAVRVTETPWKVTRYLFKSITRRRSSFDALLILPLRADELASRRRDWLD